MRESVTVLDNLLTTRQVCAMLNRSEVTIVNWRRFRGLPYISIPGDKRHSVRYDRTEVQAWAETNGELIEQGANDHEARRPGEPLANPAPGAGDACQCAA